MKKLSDLRVVDRPGYFGKRRREKEAEYDAVYANWRECWQIGPYAYSFDEAVLLYDDAYYEHLKTHTGQLGYVLHFSEVYDSDPSNIASGIEHDHLAAPRHIQDVSIRRALVRLNVWFTGQSGRPIQVRGPGTEGFMLNPGNVMFHAPELILPVGQGGPTRDWMKPGSVEYWWQKSKIIVLGD